MKKIQKDIELLLIAAVICCFIEHRSFAQEKLYPNTFPLKDVVLLDGPFRHARDLNIQTLLQYDVDRLLAPYRKEAGLPVKASGYPNWEGLDGHIGGHYLTAMAMNCAATGNAECLKRMNYMIAGLRACQDANSINNPGWGWVMPVVSLIAKEFGPDLKQAILLRFGRPGFRGTTCIRCMPDYAMPGYTPVTKRPKLFS